MNLEKLVKYKMGREVLFEVLSSYPKNWQCYPTPLTLVEKMTDRTICQNKNILILFNIEFIEVLVYNKQVNPKNIFYIADNHLEKLTAEKIYNVNVFEIPSLKNINDLMELVESLNMKFDIVFSNPPYNRGTDLKILSELLPSVKEAILVHPSTWIFDMKNKTKIYNTLKLAMDGKVKSIEFFNGNNLFDIELFVPLMITHYQESYNGNCEIDYFDTKFQSDSIFDITKFGADWKNLVKPFFLQIKNFCENNSDVWKHNKTAIDNTKFHCQLAAIRGTPVRSKNSDQMLLDDFYTMLMKNSDDNKGIRQPNLTRPGNATPTFEFDTEEERDNFINYLKTDFARFCFALLKNNNNTSVGEMELIPWLDFKQNWDDKKLSEYFNVTQEMQDYICKFLPDFHGIR